MLSEDYGLQEESANVARNHASKLRSEKEKVKTARNRVLKLRDGDEKCNYSS